MLRAQGSVGAACVRRGAVRVGDQPCPPHLPGCPVGGLRLGLFTNGVVCEPIRIHWALFFVGITAGLPFEDKRPTVSSRCGEKVRFAVLDQKSKSVREGPGSASATREMAALHSGDKKRVLPSWMTAQGPEKTVSLVQTPKRKRRRMATVPAAAARWDAFEPGSLQCWQIREVGRRFRPSLQLLGGARAACRRRSELCPLK